MSGDMPTIYTAPFSALDALRKAGIRPVAISYTIPEFARDIDHMVELAPDERVLRDYKEGIISQQTFVVTYIANLMSRFSAPQCIRLAIFNQFGIETDLALVCWEKAGAFCHRRLVADLMTYANGFPVLEWSALPKAQPTDQPLFRRRT